MKIALAGPGLMGSQLGCELAIGGHEVTFLVRRRDEGERRVGAAFELALSLGLWPVERVENARERVRYADGIAALAADTELLLESIIEERAAKIALLSEAARYLPDAILASNTSSISIGELGEGCEAPERTLGLHFLNPPMIMPLVEVISGPKTDPALVERAADLIQGIGKRPMLVEKDVPGFVWNRLQLALLREAIWIVENGVATPEVVDEIMRDGLARRWRNTGPFEAAALGGADTFTRVAANLWPELSTATTPEGFAQWLPDDPERLAAMVRARDARLLEDLRRDRADDVATAGEPSA